MKNVTTLRALRYLVFFLLICMSTKSRAQTVPCEGAIAQTNSTDGLCIGCYTEQPDLAVDNNRATYSTLHVAIGLLGSYTEQRLRFSSVSQPGDSIHILLTYPQGLLALSLLGSIQVATYNGTTYNNDRKSIDVALIQLRLIGSDQSLLSWAPAQPFDQVEIRLNSGLIGALNDVGINYANRVVPQPHLQHNLVSVCSGETAVLGADSLQGVSYLWYKQASEGSSIYNGTRYTTGPVLADSVYYVQAVRNGCANPQRSVVNVNALQLPAAPVVSPDNTSVCSNESAIFTVPTQRGIVHNWYDQLTGGTLKAIGDTFTTPPLKVAANYYANSIDMNGCLSPSRTVAKAGILPPGPGISMGTRTTMGGTGGDAFVAVINTSDKEHLAVGNSASNDGDLAGQNHGSVDFWVLKLDSSNKKIWSKAIGTSGRDSATGVVMTKDGKYIISGIYNLQSTSPTGQLVCIDSLGNQVWSKQVPFRNAAPGPFLKDSNIAVAGTTGGSLQLIVVNSMGAVLKTTTFNGHYSNDRISIVTTEDKGLLIAGSTISGGIYGRDIFIDKIDSNLNRQWEKVFLDKGEDVNVRVFESGVDHFGVSCVTLADTLKGATVKLLRIDADGVPDYIKILGPLTPPLPVTPNPSPQGRDADQAKVVARGLIGLAGMPVETAWCATLGRESTYCPCGGRRPKSVPENASVKAYMPRLSNWKGAISGPKSLKTINGSLERNGVMYLLELDSLGNIVALQTDSANAVTTTALANSMDGGAILLGASNDSLSKAAVIKIDPPSCLPATAPIFPKAVASIIQDQKLMVYKEPSQNAEKENAIPLLEVFPNPFSEIVTCRYAIKTEGRVILRLTHTDARRDVILKDEATAPGVYNLRVNTSGYPSGVYILTLKQGNKRQTVKIVKL